MKDGGPAFPKLERSIPESLNVRGARIDYVHRSAGGMTLRDYFAGQALAGALAAMTDPNVRITDVGLVSKRAYHFADAMLAERERETTP